MPRKPLAVVFCLFVAWRAIGSFASLVNEARSYDVHSLVDAVSLSQEERIRSTLQDDYEILTTLRANVPAGGLVLYVTGSDLPTVKRAMRLGLLLYPPRFAPTARLQPLVPANVRRSNAQVFAVDLTGKEKPARSAWDPVEPGQNFQLWRYRTPESSRP